MRCSASKRAAVTAAWLRRETSDYYHGLLGGLLRMRSTYGGISPLSTSRCPHPVSRITGAEGRVAFTALATAYPSTCGIPRSVITTSKRS
jgi:hypothetical protein